MNKKLKHLLGELEELQIMFQGVSKELTEARHQYVSLVEQYSNDRYLPDVSGEEEDLIESLSVIKVARILEEKKNEATRVYALIGKKKEEIEDFKRSKKGFFQWLQREAI